MALSGRDESEAEVEVHVDLYGSFREAAKTSRLSVKLPGVGTVRELLQRLAAGYGPSFQAALFQDDGELKHDAVLLLNQAVLTMRELDRALRTGDRVTLYQTISGG